MRRQRAAAGLLSCVVAAAAQEGEWQRPTQCPDPPRSPALQIDPKIENQFPTGRLLACISSRPGQSGRCDGYILEGPELLFYLKQLAERKRK